MKTRIVSLIIITICPLINGCSGTSQIPKEFVGRWEGTTGTNGQSMHVALNFSTDRISYDAPDLGSYGRPISDYSFKGDKFSIIIPGRNPLTLKGLVKNSQMTGEVSGKVPMTFSLEKKSNQPEFFYEENVTYKSGDVTLSATLIKPKSTGTYPAVVMIHGSAGEGKMTREITRNRAILFVKSGLAALIYDRRGNGKSTGEKDRLLKMELLAKDAAAGVEYLSTRADINSEKIGVYGLSQGGWVAPYATAFTNKVNFVITVSAPGITPDEQDAFAVENVVSAAIQDNLKKAGAQNQGIEQEAQNSSQAPKKPSTEEIVSGFSHYNPLPFWEKITVPVLAVWGEKDTLLPSEKSKQLIEESLVKSGNTNYTVKIFPNGDHELKIASSKPQDQSPYKMMVPGAEDFMVQWIKLNICANL